MNRNDDEEIGGSVISRRRALKCGAWLGAGVVMAMKGGVLRSFDIGDAAAAAEPGNDFTFVQISDSHIGFDKAANPDAVGTLQIAID